MNAPTGPQLRDIHLPPAPGWWPPAPGWWLLAAICIAMGVVAFRYARRRHRAQLRRRALSAELDRCIDVAGNDAAALAAQLSRFLRRMALRERPAAAALVGEAWLEYLDTRTRGEEFRRGVGRVLLDAPYRAQTEFDHAALIALVRRWLRESLQTQASHA
jgi:hypothetical protein